jgi:ribosomal protein S18 acetylase RimI-like enzyme
MNDVGKVMLIRKGKETDLPSIKEIFKEFVQLHVEIDPCFKKIDQHDEIFTRYILNNLKNEKTNVLVAELDGVVVGYSIGQIQERPPIYEQCLCGHIDNMAVLAECRRKGIGEKLFQEIKSWFRSQGIERIELFVAIKNEESINFWRKMGFEPYLEHMYTIL